MSALNFKISAQLEAAGFKQAADYMKTLSGETQKNREANKEHAGTVNLLKTAYGALLGLGIVEFFKSAYEEAAQAREQEIQLAARVEQTGLNYEKAKPKLDAFFDALQQQSGVAKDKLIPAFNELIDKTQNVRQSQELMAATMGLARARGMQLAESATIMAGAVNGEQRALSQLARMMGLTTSEAKDHEKVIALAKQRYSEFATNTDATARSMANLQNSFKDFKEQVGAGFANPLALITDLLKNFLVSLSAGTEALGVNMALWVSVVRVNLEMIPKIVKGGFQQAKVEARFELAELRKSADEELKKIGDRLRAAVSPKDTSDLDNFVDRTLKKYSEMNDSMRVLLAEGNLAGKRSDRDRLDAQIELIDKQNEAYRNQLHQQAEWGRLAAEDQQALDTAILKKGIAEKIKAWEQYSKITTATVLRTADAMGKAMARSLMGQEDAWKQLLVGIIEDVGDAVKGYIAAWATAKIAEQLMSEDYAGAVKTGLIAAGATAAVSAGVEAAKGAIGGNGSASSSGGGGSSTITMSSGGGQAQAAPAAGQKSSVSIYVYGDVVDSDAFMNSLAAKLSDKVENQDIKLVASSVKN